MLDDERREQADSRFSDRWQDDHLYFERQRVDLLLQRVSLQKQRQQLRQQRISLEQERLRLSNRAQAGGMLRDGGGPVDPLEQEHVQMMQNLAERLGQIRQSFCEAVQVIQERFDALREQQLILNEQANPSQQHEDFHQIQASYRQLRTDLQEYRRSLRQQQADYHQLRLDYHDAQQRVAAQRAVLRQRWEEQRGGGQWLIIRSSPIFTPTLYIHKLKGYYNGECNNTGWPGTSHRGLSTDYRPRFLCGRCKLATGTARRAAHGGGAQPLCSRRGEGYSPG